MSTDNSPDALDQTTDENATEDTTPEDHVMSLLSEHVPLSLIVDLSTPEGPDSQEILTEEGEPEDAWWDVAGDGAAAADDDDETSEQDAPN